MYHQQTCIFSISYRSTKGNFSSGREMTPDGNLDSVDAIKSTGNGKYLGKYKGMYIFSFVFLTS